MTGEGGWIRSLEDNNVAGQDDVRLTDRFFLGEPQMRGFDIRGVGPRIVRLQYLDDDNDAATPRVSQTIEEALASDSRVDDALGGKAYYLGRAELEIPLGSGAREMGLRPSIFLDVGSLFSVTRPVLQDYPDGLQATDGDGNLLYLQPGVDDEGNDILQAVTNRFAPDGTENERNVIGGTFFKEVFVGDSPAPRISVGIGVNWNSPFGPFRIDVSHVLKKQVGDDTKTFSFNVGTQF